MHHLWKLDRKLKKKIDAFPESGWLTSLDQYRLMKIKDKVSVHINNRLGRK